MQQPANQTAIVPLLTQQIQRNEAAVLKKLYQDNVGGVTALVLKNSGTADDAGDLYQEAFLAVWRAVQMSRFLPVSEKEFSAYLFQVARFKWIDQLRSRKGRKLVALQDWPSEAVMQEPWDEDMAMQTAAVRAAFPQLGDNCRELLGRFYFKKEPLREIASFFGWTEATAKNNKYRCLQKLRGLLQMNKPGSTHE
ncbi:MAG: sigma-70 family RNA polymerase sigma factor [Chitinophagaceae bacterium]|nr:sigma-70 family RNA polymerase sigma factor [Chitinophagaceae bacterium]